jgi:hypothetical protein
MYLVKRNNTLDETEAGFQMRLATQHFLLKYNAKYEDIRRHRLSYPDM